MANDTPGILKGVTEFAIADADATAAGVIGVLLLPEKTPMRNEASCDERTVSIIRFVLGFVVET